MNSFSNASCILIKSLTCNWSDIQIPEKVKLFFMQVYEILELSDEVKGEELMYALSKKLPKLRDNDIN